MMNLTKSKALVPAAIFLLTVLVVARYLVRPFEGIHDWNGARYGNIARNYLRYGFGATRFGQVENSGEVSAPEFEYYTHFPPLLPIVISISYRVFGVSEWATRLVPTLATAGTIVIIYIIGTRLFGHLAGISSALFALATPMVRYFGKNPVHEPLALFFASLAFLGAVGVLSKKKGWALIYIGVLLTLLTNWSGVFLIFALTIIFFKKIYLRKICRLWLLGLAIGVLHFVHVYLLTGSFSGGGLMDALLQRTGIGPTAALTTFSVFGFINRLRIWSSTLFTLSLLLVSLGGFILVLKKGSSLQKRMIVGTLIYSFSYPLVFPNATFIHSYFIFGLTLPAALLGGYFSTSYLKNKLAQIVLIIVIFSGIWLERGSYLKALDVSRGDYLAYKIGNEMAVEIPKDEEVYVTPFDYAASRLPFLAFYSDRKIVLTPDSGYNWIVEVDQSRESFQILRREK